MNGEREREGEDVGVGVKSGMERKKSLELVRAVEMCLGEWRMGVKE